MAGEVFEFPNKASKQIITSEVEDVDEETKHNKLSQSSTAIPVKIETKTSSDMQLSQVETNTNSLLLQQPETGKLNASRAESA